MIKFDIKNNSGVTLLDTLVSLTIFLIIVLLVSQFQIFTKQNSRNLDKKVALLQAINNEITEIYTIEDWSSLTNKTISTKLGDVDVSYSDYIEKTSDLTNKITVKFDFEGKEELYNLERSVYFGK